MHDPKLDHPSLLLALQNLNLEEIQSNPSKVTHLDGFRRFYYDFRYSNYLYRLTGLTLVRHVSAKTNEVKLLYR